ncbi:hypothetical protein LguiB_018802 [Lonicera macranthoides]
MEEVEFETSVLRFLQGFLGISKKLSSFKSSSESLSKQVRAKHQCECKRRITKDFVDTKCTFVKAPWQNLPASKDETRQAYGAVIAS